MNERARIVVIGGGVVGAAILWHLAEAGETDAVLLEKHELTAGSTWHAAGNVPTFSNTWLGQRAGNYAWRLYSRLADDPNDRITYRHTQAIWPGHTESRLDHFQHLLGIAAGLGFDLQLLSPSEIEAAHPFWEDDGTVVAGLLDPYEGDIDPSQLTHSLARRARALGARIRRNTRVVGIEANPEGWTVRCDTADDRIDVDCEIVINAAGFYAGEVARMVGVELPIAILEHQYLVTDSVPELEEIEEPFPLIRDPELMFYLRREQDAWLFGNYGHRGRVAWSDGAPEVFDSRLFSPEPDDIAATAERAMAHLPVLGRVGVARLVNGPIAYSPDANPLVGSTAGLRGFYQAAGVQIGVTQAAAIGKVLTEMIIAGDTEWDVFSWDPRRFGGWATRGYASARTAELYEHQYAEPFPHRIWPSARPVRATPLYETLAAKGANFGEIAGWERAFWFSARHRYEHESASYRDEHWHGPVAAECEAVRDRVGVMDHGGFTRFEVRGPGAVDFVDYAFSGRAPDVGRVKLSYMLRPNGSVWSEATIARLADDHLLLLGPTAARERDHDHLLQMAPDGVELSHGSDRTATLMVMGPESRRLLQRLTAADLSRVAAPWMSVREITVAGVPTTALRVSFVGELGWELHLEEDDLTRVYEAVHAEGAELGISDFGSYALNAMRIEKGFHGWGTEFNVEYTLFDAGLERFVDFDKPDFVGREAALAQRHLPSAWSYGVFTIDVDEVPGAPSDPAPSAPIRVDGEIVGYVTSASYGFRTGARVALGYVDGRHRDTTAGFTIDVLGTPCPAIRHTHGIYDPSHSLMRG